jgi:hypothetical protein
MPIIRLPSTHDTSYVPARGPALLLSCMDLRCLDEIVEFMDHDGLTNRYDHVILAGASLGALGGCQRKYEHWEKMFWEHLKLAYDLHHIKDVYIMEHRDCGAYRKFLGPEGDFDDNQQEKEKRCHAEYAVKLSKKIHKWARTNKAKIRVRSFLMDLRGKVELLDPPSQ